MKIFAAVMLVFEKKNMHNNCTNFRFTKIHTEIELQMTICMGMDAVFLETFYSIKKTRQNKTHKRIKNVHLIT
jgi:hypothetical protein